MRKHYLKISTCCFVAALLLTLLLLFGCATQYDASKTGGDAATTNIGLTKPGRGSANWDRKLNTNFDALDTAIGGLNSAIDDLPEVERHTGAFNGSTGTVITLTRPVDATNEYGVEITPTGRTTAIGDIWVEKGVASFAVYCSGANTTDGFEAIVYHTGDSTSYGGSIYRRYYVSPSTSITDHSDPGTTGSLAAILAAMSGTSGIVELPGNRTYTITANDVTIPAGIHLRCQPGAVLSVGSGRTLTINSPDHIIASKKQQLFSGDGGVRFTIGGTVYSEMWGAVGDGSADDTDSWTSAIESMGYLSAGEVVGLYKTYAVNNLELAPYVAIRGVQPNFSASHAAGVRRNNKTVFIANASGAILSTPTTEIMDAVVENINFVGLGAGTAVRGIYLDNATRCTFRHCTFDNFADQAVLIDEGNANLFEKLFGMNCLLNRTRSAKTGVFEIGASSHDNYVETCEFTASSTSLSDANSYLCAVLIKGANNFLKFVIGEISDVGIRIEGQGDNHLVACRADLNYGNGVEISVGSNTLIGVTSKRNSRAATNGYDAFYLTVHANTLVGCVAKSLSADGWYHRYGFNDATMHGANNRNYYSACQSILHGTAKFNCADYLGSGPEATSDNNWNPFADGDTTPDVSGGKLFVCNYSSDTTITDFDGAPPGHCFRVVQNSGAGTVTFDHGANIRTNTGADKELTWNRLHTFCNVNGVLIEQE